MTNKWQPKRQRTWPKILIALVALGISAVANEAFAQRFVEQDTMAKEKANKRAVEVARRPTAAELRRQQQVFWQAQQQQYAQRVLQQQAAAKAYVDQLAWDRFYAVQDLWVVTMRSPQGFVFFKPYLGRGSGDAQYQAMAEFPQAMIQHIRRYNFRN